MEDLRVRMLKAPAYARATWKDGLLMVTIVLVGCILGRILG